MIWDRFVGYVIKLRGILTWFWPFMVATAVTANLVVLVLLVVRQAETLEETKQQTIINRRLIERGNPCIKGDPPDSEACIAKAAADQRLAEALAAVQAQHDAQAAQIDDAVARLVELQERQHGNSVTPRVPSTIPKRPAPRITATTTTATAAVVTTTSAPTTTTKPKGRKP